MSDVNAENYWPVLYTDPDNLQLDENMQANFEHDLIIDGLAEKVAEEKIQTEKGITEQKKKQQLRNTITRLARYPNVIERPYCNAVINGENLVIQILSKRGDEIKVSSGREVLFYSIDDFEQLSII